MSNVLIGIIGVILFIGLALAGALFLGPRFQESTLNSKASAAVQAVSQVASAAEMFRVQEGVSLTGVSPDNLRTKGYLKAIPSSLAGAGVVQLGTVDTLGQVSYFVMPNDSDFLRICAAIVKQTTGQTVAASSEDDFRDTNTATSGCAYDGGVDGLVVYSKI